MMAFLGEQWVGPAAGTLLLLGAALVAVFAGLWWTFTREDRIAQTEFRVFLAIVSVWCLLQIVEVFGGPTVAYYASFGSRAARGLMAVSWFYFTMVYAGYGDVVYGRVARAVVGGAAVYLLTVTSVPWIAATVTFEQILLVEDPFVAVAFRGVTPVRRLSQFIGYALVSIGSLGLAYRFLNTGYTHHWRVGVFVGAVAAVVVFDFVVERTVPPVPGIDYAVVGTAASSLLLILVLYRHDPFGALPVGRDDVFEIVEDAVFVVNPRGRLLDWNAAARELRADLSVGRPLEEVLPDPVVEDPDLSTDGDGRATVDVVVDGIDRQFDVVVSVLETGGERRGTAYIFREVTEMKRQERALARKNDRLEEFASVVSHDLRNPLHVASGKLELARETHDDPTLDDAAAAVDRAVALLDDLLELAHEGRRAPDLEPVALADTVDEAWATVDTATATLRNDADGRIRADRSRLRQLLANLYRNAVEHGGADVTVRVGSLEDGFYVADDGPGIPPADRETVFEPGFTTGEDGTGFGLNIVREIVAAHDWTIEVTESVDGGARFEVTGIDLAPETFRD